MLLTHQIDCRKYLYIKPTTTIIHSEHDDVVSIEDSKELLKKSGLPESKLIVVGHEHRLADEESLGVMLRLTGRRSRSLCPKRN